jgi:NAD(P)H-dependent FMN reductase
MPQDSQMQIVPIEEIPLYSADIEAESGIPVAVTRAKAALADAHGLVIATPEYNGGIPGVAKNAIDWMSRPSDDIGRVFHGKWVALMGATPGGFGTVFAQTGWLHVLRTLRMRLWTDAGPFYVSHANKVFDENGLADAEQRSRLADYMAAYVDRVRLSD